MAYDFEKERIEAIAAGERALTSLRAAREELRSAGNWGLVDLFGGGMISGLVKHSKMGNAQRYMEQAKLDLQSFSRELQDVNMTHNLNLNVGDFLTFADFFFDGLIADWLVQDRINETKNQVEDAIRQVEDIVRRLRIL